MNKIIAIVGMCGSGKSVAVNYFLKFNYKKVYFGGITFDKLKEENIEINPENEKIMQIKLRDKYGMAAYAILSLPKIKELIKTDNVVIDGLYSWDELKVLEKEFKEQLIVIAIVADKNIRYKRLENRDFRPYSLIEANKRDIFEIENVAKSGPIAYADYFVINNSDVSILENKLNMILSEIENN